MPGGDLGLGLAEELERLRPFGMGNPQPTLLVPGRPLRARDRHGGGQGALPLHARHRRRREVARRGVPARRRGTLAPAAGASPRHRPAARAQPLERSRGAARDPARALPDRAGRARACSARTSRFWDELGAPARDAELPAHRRGSSAAASRTAAARASPASPGDLFSSGESVLVAVADVPRRRAGLEAVVAGLAGGPMPVTSWGALAAKPALAEGFDHLVALDPPPGGAADPLLSVPQRPPRLGPGRGGVRDRRLARRARPAPAADRGLPRPARAAAPNATAPRPRSRPARARPLSAHRARLRPPRSACSPSSA